MPRELSFSPTLLGQAELFLKWDLNQLYLSVGSQLAALESEHDEGTHKILMEEQVSLGLPMGAVEPLTQKGREFLKKYWLEVRKEACEWLKQNTGKYVGSALITGLATAIATAFPPPWNGMTPILAMVAAILINAGVAVVCNPAQITPP